MTAASRFICLLFVVMTVMVVLPAAARGGSASRWADWDPLIRSPVDLEKDVDDQLANSTRWGLLVAGSKEFKNYRHQANVCHAYQILKRGGLEDENIIVFMYDDIAYSDMNPRPGIIIHHPKGEDVYAGVPKANVCHAYQILKRGGLEDENIIVFMYDDIAYSDMNPRPGIIIHHPKGEDVYAGVPKDYTGEDVTMDNLYAVLLGDKSAVKGGSGKVLDTKPDDRIFFYYTDHGAAGLLGMPEKPWIVAKDFIDVLKKKHAMGTYKEMVIYVEACESGSIFEGLLPQDINIYAVTSTDSEEGSNLMYCPGEDLSPPPEYTVCLADQFSAAWMEDSDKHNLKKESIEQQYKQVKERTSDYGNFNNGSHVMEYGTKSIKPEKIYLYQGFNPESMNFPDNQVHTEKVKYGINQRDADLLFLWEKYKKSSKSKKVEVLKEISEILRHREHLDNIINTIGVFLVGPKNSSSILHLARGRGLPLVDDWDCFKSTVRLFEKHCGFLSEYGMTYMRAFANLCNNVVENTKIEEAFAATCSDNRIEPYGSSGTYSV